MKKNLLIIMFSLILSMNLAFAGEFDSLNGISPAQKQKLSQINAQYKIQNDLLDQKIISYNTKLSALRADNTKSPAEVAMLSATYEKNLETLKEQQKKLQLDTDELYKSVMTLDQYSAYKKQNIEVENAFKNFLDK